jgi:GTP cyclohydrolase II
MSASAASLPDASLSVARAVDELRRGQVVMVSDGDVQLALLALEQASETTLMAFEGAAKAQARLLVSAARAATLKLTADRAAAGEAAVLVARPAWMDLSAMMAAADPVDDLASPLKGPFQAMQVGAHARAALAALRLLKLARLLPAGLVILQPEAELSALAVTADNVLSHAARQSASLKIAASAKVPLLATENTRIVAFRSDDGGMEHLAILIGDPSRTEPVLVRLHSECLTGDLLGSLKCDCGPQLQGAMKRIAEEPEGGVLLYLAQEGRGIGLINKLRAYSLQDQGFDTVDANTRLGFEVDERNFAPAAKMLKLLGFSTIRLLTNNPQKVAGLEAEGIMIEERVAHELPHNAHNENYLRTKKLRTGHLLK